MVQKTLAWYASAAVLIVVVIFAGYLLAHQRNLGSTSLGDTSSSTLATQASANQTGSAQANLTGVVSSDQGAQTSLPEPSLTRPYTPPSDVPANVQAQDVKAVNDAIAQLKIDPSHIAYWLQLAIYRKGSGDYTGAEEIWLYCIARWPTDPTAYNNLADLYGNYLHEYDKAVEYWHKLIALQPSNIPAYLNLATLYSINLHDSTDAKATLEAGLKANPSSVDLKNALAALQ